MGEEHMRQYMRLPGKKSDSQGLLFLRVGLRLLGGGDCIADEKENQGMILQTLSLVLNAIRLIVELL